MRHTVLPLFTLALASLQLRTAFVPGRRPSSCGPRCSGCPPGKAALAAVSEWPSDDVIRTRRPWRGASTPPWRRRDRDSARFTYEEDDEEEEERQPRWQAFLLGEEGPLEARGFATALRYLGQEEEDCWEGAIALLDEMGSRQLSPTGEDFTSALRAFARGGRWEAALALRDAMKAVEAPEGPEAFGALLGTLGTAGRWTQALHVLDSMRAEGVRRDFGAFGGAITACAKKALWVEALTVLTEAYVEGHQPDAESFGEIIKACAAGRRYDIMQEMLSAMWEQDLQPTLTAYNAVLGGLALKGWRHVVGLLAVMRDEECKPDEYTFNTAIESCQTGVRVGWRQALIFFQNMRKRRLAPSFQAYFALIDCCVQAKRLGVALDLLTQGRQRGLNQRILERGIDEGPVGHAAALLAWQEQNDWRQVLHLTQQMQLRGLLQGERGERWQPMVSLVLEEAASSVPSIAASNKLKKVAKGLSSLDSTTADPAWYRKQAGWQADQDSVPLWARD